MWFSLLTLATALIISISAAYYSILGLTAIFAAAFWPIVILGSSLEVGKIVSTLWLHKYWDRAEVQYKVYLCAAVAILMLLTSMGVFGFLSKAHTDQDLVSGDVVARISIYDEKIKQSRDNIDMARRALTQMDAAVDQTLGRSTTETGADKAAQLRRSQATERNRLLKEIDTEQKKIQQISEERAPIAAEVRKVEAEVGPIKYIAALIYGDNPEANLLEKAVRWVIILIVIVFDPLALTLLLAATKSIEWERGINIMTTKRKEPDYEPDDGPLTADQLDQLRKTAQDDLPSGTLVSKSSLFQEPEEFFDRAKATAQAIDSGTYSAPEEPNPYQTVKADTNRWYDHVDEPDPVKKENTEFTQQNFDDLWNHPRTQPAVDSEADHAPLELPADLEHPVDLDNEEEEIDESHADSEERKIEVMCERAWKEENPNKTLKRERQRYRAGIINELPWNNAEFQERVKQLHSNLIGFGGKFPENSVKGDMFLQTTSLPSVLYKFNGTDWIAVDKAMSDQYVYDNAYIDFLIDKIGTGEYDPDLLSDAERDRIEQRLNNNSA
jgi:hypothetical protein